jgi:hypothetical protein
MPTVNFRARYDPVSNRYRIEVDGRLFETLGPARFAESLEALRAAVARAGAGELVELSGSRGWRLRLNRAVAAWVLEYLELVHASVEAPGYYSGE